MGNRTDSLDSGHQVSWYLPMHFKAFKAKNEGNTSQKHKTHATTLVLPVKGIRGKFN